MTIGIVHTAQLGLQRSLQRFEQAAGDIARATLVAADQSAAVRGGGQNLLDPLVRLLVARQSFAANQAVLRAGDRMLGTLIDRLA